MKKRKIKGKIIVFSAIALIVAAVVIFAIVNKDTAEYNTTVVKNRDIVTYFNFSGNVRAENSNPIIAPHSLKVKSVSISEGDYVKAGDIVAVLDSAELEKQLRTQESNVEVNNINLSYAYTQSQKSYNEALQKYNNGLNSDINNAENAVTAAKLTLDNANKKYEDAQKNLNDQSNSTILEAKSNLEPAEINYRVSKDDYMRELKDHSYPETVEKVLTMEDKLTAIQARIDNAKAEMRSAQGVDNAVVEAAAQKLNDAQDEYDDLLEDIYENLNGYSAKIARKQMEGYKEVYDNTKDALNDTIKSVDVNLSDIKNAVDSSKLNYDKSQTMLEITKISVTQQLESYKNAMEKDKKVIDNQPALLELANLKSKINDCTIKSDYTGMVTSVNVTEGGMVSMGQPIAEVIDNQKLEVKMSVDEYDILSVSKGAEVSVYINSLNKELKGVIKLVSEAATVQNGMSFFTATATLEESDNVKSGMSAEVKLLNSKAEGVPTLPITAIRFDSDNNPYVYVKENGKIVEREITVGINDGNLVEIKEGLIEGDIIYVPKSLGLSMFDMMGM